MDEADILGDRIAIMAQGQLRCCGSSLFLKKKYGVGYQLSIEKAKRLRHRIGNSGSYDDIESVPQSSSLDGDTNYDKTLKTIVQGSVQNAALLSTAAGEIKFQIPVNESESFVPMLRQLDVEVAHGHIASYGLSLTTLEEVFILVSKGDNIDDRRVLDQSQRLSLAAKGFVAPGQNDLERENLFIRHVMALFRKRWLNFKRDRKAWLFTTILPSFIVFLGFLFNDSLEVFAVWFLVVL